MTSDFMRNLVSVEVLAAPPKPRAQITRAMSGGAYETRCSACGGPAYALGGGSLWCARCLRPFMAAGERFQPSISVRRAAEAAV